MISRRSYARLRIAVRDFIRDHPEQVPKFPDRQKSNLIPEHVDDLKLLKPFPKVANKTAIVLMRKVSSKILTTYPVPYTVWEKTPGQSGSIPEHTKKSAVLGHRLAIETELTGDGGDLQALPVKFQDHHEFPKTDHAVISPAT